MTLEKPIIEFPAGDAPEDLDILDIVVGTGPEAQAGDTVDVHYVGVKFRDGEEFDASWNRGESITFPLRGLIQGWQEGIPGMKVGGRRQLTIPPEKAYGPAGGGHQLSGEPLIFVIDLLGIEGAGLTKPTVSVPGGADPEELQILDIVVGNGKEATPGATVKVHYVGVKFRDGQQFDASWDRGESIEFPLRGLIQGWQEGIPGMKVGGRRELTIPPAKAYGPAGGGHQLSGEPLVFVIDLLGVK